ncbi:unnamed protein product, partial [Rotaria magnacalcarata]
SNFTLKILVLFGTENLKHRNKDSINFKFKIELQNSKFEKTKFKIVMKKQTQNLISKFEIVITIMYNFHKIILIVMFLVKKQLQNRREFTIRDRNRISKFEIAITSNEKQIQNHRFASMAYETEHDFWLKISFPKPARRVFERV